jgi:hypothetical protein
MLAARNADSSEAIRAWNKDLISNTANHPFGNRGFAFESQVRRNMYCLMARFGQSCNPCLESRAYDSPRWIVSADVLFLV